MHQPNRHITQAVRNQMIRNRVVNSLRSGGKYAAMQAMGWTRCQVDVFIQNFEVTADEWNTTKPCKK